MCARNSSSRSSSSFRFPKNAAQRLNKMRIKSISVSYSVLSAFIGSVRAARSAGKIEAVLAMKVSATTAPISTQGSLGDVSYKKLASARQKPAGPQPVPHPRRSRANQRVLPEHHRNNPCSPRAQRHAEMPISLSSAAAVAYDGVP